MESEATTLLRARGAELDQQVGELRARLKILQEEQLQIEVGLQAMTGVLICANGSNASRQAIIHHARAAHSDTDRRTIKQLVMEALSGPYVGGASANDLLFYFARQYGRDDIVRTSLSPQLSRLKEEGKIRREGRVWRVNEDEFDALLGDDDPHNENGAPEGAPEARPDANPA